MKQNICKSPPMSTPKLSYSQVTKMGIQPHDPGKLICNLTCDKSCDPIPPVVSCDPIAHDHGNIPHDLPRDWSSSMLPNKIHFGHATCLLINTWKTVGTINKEICQSTIQPRYNTTRCNEIQHNKTQYNKMQCNKTQYDKIQYNKT